MANKSELEEGFLDAWRELSPFAVHEPTRQQHVCEGRLWRFDFAWPEIKVAVEMEGCGPGHQGTKKFREDCEKYNTATAMGWRIFRFMSTHLRECNRQNTIDMVCEAMTLIATERELNA